MNSKEIMDLTEDNCFHVYNRFNVVFDKGDGVTLYDVEGKEYLDFASGIGVMALGYNNKEFNDAIKAQVDKLYHTSNLYYHPALADAAKKLCEISGMDKVFFTNSGAEAVEGAIKTAKKYAYNKYDRSGYGIIAMDNSFHGRTVGALSVTGTEAYRKAFLPLMDKVTFATYNDYDSVEAAIDADICAIILEPVQGEGGVMPADKEFLQKIRKVCDERDIILIFDEIQCGMGRTGSVYAYQDYDVKPDILLTAKALGGGLPIGAFLVTDKVASSSLVPGDHGTTYGGNPLCTAAVKASIDLMLKNDLVGNVNSLAPYLESKLDEVVDSCKCAIGHRGKGFMQGIVLDDSIKASDVVKTCLDKGLVVLSAGGNVLRLLPPLVISKEDIDKAIEIIKYSLNVT
ncbi:MAG: aspartate aminotransferase family protein [Lachnospiraceae bacterium]|nr:aspartate aminotransferase family protein [Lachnospiraceae bacterium]